MNAEMEWVAATLENANKDKLLTTKPIIETKMDDGKYYFSNNSK